MMRAPSRFLARRRNIPHARKTRGSSNMTTGRRQFHKIRVHSVHTCSSAIMVSTLKRDGDILQPDKSRLAPSAHPAKSDEGGPVKRAPPRSRSQKSSCACVHAHSRTARRACSSDACSCFTRSTPRLQSSEVLPAATSRLCAQLMGLLSQNTDQSILQVHACTLIGGSARVRLA